MKSLGRTLIAGWLLLCLAASPLWAITERQRIERLEMLADVWGKLYLFHPRIVERNLNWNKILVETIPKIEKASGTDELVAALNESLFLPLDDPFTVAQRNENISPGPARKLMARQLSEGVGYIDATDPRQYGPDSAHRIQELVRGLGPIKTLVVDLRFAGPQGASLEWLSLFLESPQVTGGLVGRMHDGWSEHGDGGFYGQRWNVNPGLLMKPLPDTRVLQIPTVFVVNNSSYYYKTAALLDVLQTIRGSRIILEQRGQSFTNASYLEDLKVFLPQSMMLSRSGYLGARPDYVNKEPIAEGELPALARELLEGKQASASTPRSFGFEMTFPDRDSFSDEPISREARLAGLFKVWTIISYMDLHVQYASVDWSTVLREWIPKVESVGSAPADYFNSLRELTAKLNDSHVGISIRTPGPSAIPPRNLPIRLRPVEGKPIVIGTFQGASGEEPPVQVGDEILAINGKSIDDLFAEQRPRISASSPGALLRNLVNMLSSTQRRDAIEVLLRNDAGQRSVNLETIPRRQLVPPSRTPSSQVVSQSSYEILQRGFGYIDLGTLTEKEIDPAFDAIAGTKGLILDMRGYPQTFIQLNLVPRISEKPVHSTILEVPQVSTPERRVTATRESFTWVNPHPSKRFANPIVVLIDDRAQSAAEDFCIYLRNAKRAIFVGSATAGTNGGVTYIDLPGGRQMSFTGTRVKFADGSRFQNIGIIPDVRVEPTIRGIRAGRDEVLEKGIETLEQLVAQAGIERKR